MKLTRLPASSRVVCLHRRAARRKLVQLARATPQRLQSREGPARDVQQNRRREVGRGHAGHVGGDAGGLGDRVFATAADTKTGKQCALSLDRRTGAIQWRVDISELTDRWPIQQLVFTFARDGREARGVFLLGMGELVAFEVGGKKLWERNLGPFAFQWTFSSSPLLHDGRLLVQVLQRDVAVRGKGKSTGNESYLLALDAHRQGPLAARASLGRGGGVARGVQHSPALHPQRSPRNAVVGGDAITGHDPASGRELWRWGTWNPTKIGHWRLVPSPTVGAGV